MATLKIATVCILLLCVGSDLARPAICLASSPDDQEAAAVGTLLRELLVERELIQKLSLLLAEQHGGGGGVVCTAACQKCLRICWITCVLNASPATCFVNCTLASGCFSKTLPVA